MSKEYKCGTCGVVTVNKQHLCQPQEQADGAHCGSVPTQSVSMCDSIDQNASYTCSGCGRASVDPELLCQPKQRDK